MPDANWHEAVPQPTHVGAPAIRNLLALTKVEAAKPLTYFFGACWDHSGDFTNDMPWENDVKRFAGRRDRPLRLMVGTRWSVSQTQRL